MGSSFKLTGPLIGNLENGKRKLAAAMAETTRFQAPRAQNYMRQNARWTDRSTNARNGLNATPEISGNTYAIIVGHTMPYGIWLEVRFSGRYAIVDQTVQNQGIEWMALCSRVMGRLT